MSREDYNKSRRKYYSLHRRRILQRCAAYREKNRVAIKSRQLSYHLKHRHGITEQDKNDLLKLQNGRCAICCRKISGRSAHVDHDHDSGVNRGLLCFGCNAGLGNFKDHTPALYSAIDYLIKWTLAQQSV